MNFAWAHRLSFYLVLLTLPFQLNYFFWPTWSYVLGRPIDLLAPSIYIADLFIFLTAVFWFSHLFIITNKKPVLLSRVVSFNRNSKKYLSIHVWKQWINNHTRQLAVLGLVSLLYGLLLLSPTHFSSGIWGLVLISKWLFLFVYIIKTQPSKKLIIAGLLPGTILASSIGMLQTFGGQSLGLTFLGERIFSLRSYNIAKAIICLPDSINFGCISVLRAYGTFPHPNVLAGFISFLLLLFLGRSIILDSKKLLLGLLPNLRSHIILSIQISVLCVLLLGLVATFSRSGWLMLFLGIFWWLKRFSTRIKVLVTSLLILGILFLTIPFINTSALNGESFAIRKELNSSALEMLKDDPWLGVGFRNFIPNLPRHLVTRGVYFLQPAHNLYLLIISELGLLRVGLIGILLVVALRLLSIKFNKDHLYLLVPLLLIGLLDHYLLTLQQGQALVCLSLGLIFTYNNQKS